MGGELYSQLYDAAFQEFSTDTTGADLFIENIRLAHTDVPTAIDWYRRQAQQEGVSDEAREALNTAISGLEGAEPQRANSFLRALEVFLVNAVRDAMRAALER